MKDVTMRPKGLCSQCGRWMSIWAGGRCRHCYESTLNSAHIDASDRIDFYAERAEAGKPLFSDCTELPPLKMRGKRGADDHS